MSRFDLDQWCDFIRGVTDAAAAEEMRRELTRDDTAKRRVELLERVQRVAEHDLALDIPDYALRIAKAAASVRRFDPSPETASPRPSVWRFLPIKLAFDSFSQPLPAGTRNVQSASRELSFEAEEFTVELRLEHDAHGVALTGHLLRDIGEIEPVTETPVLVLGEGGILGRSVTSAFGEFQAEGLPEGELKLCVLTSQGKCIAIPLPGDPVGGAGSH